MGCDPAGLSAEPAGLDWRGVTGQADELGATDDDGRVLTAPGAMVEGTGISTPAFTAVPLPVDGALHRPHLAAGRACDGSGVPFAAGAATSAARRLVRHADSTAARLARRQDNPTRALGDERVRKVLNRHRHIRVTSFENSGLLEESELEQALRERHRSDRAHDLNETFRRDLDRDPLDEHHDLCDTRLLRRLGHDGLLGAWTADGGANGPEIADRPASRFFAHGDRGRGLAAGDRHKIVEGALQRVAECGEDVETHPLRRLRHQPIDLLSGEADAALLKQRSQLGGLEDAA